MKTSSFCLALFCAALSQFAVPVAHGEDAALSQSAPVVEVRDMPQSGQGRLLRKINTEWKCEYSPSLRSRAQLRGVQVSKRFGGEKDFSDLREWGANVVRLPVDCAGGTNLEAHAASVAAWLERMQSDILPRAEKYGIGVIPCLFDVPGGREKTADFRMFGDRRYLDAFRETWKTIASRLKGSRAIAGYDLCNEPHQSHFAAVADYWTVQRLAAEDIRAIDPETPIVVEAYGWDGPEAFWAMSPMKLANIVYEVHMYYPMAYTHQGLYDWRQGPEYPCASNGWDRAYMKKTLSQVRDFELRHGARIFCGEFSAAAWAKGADRYIADCISVFDEYGWDWTYHAFREYEGWSVEHEGTSRRDCPRVAYETRRKKVLLDGLKGKTSACRADVGADKAKMLVVGNSIVRHQVAPKLGWTNDWGMAASAREKDFAHLVASGIERHTGRPVELRIHDTKGLEFNYKTYDAKEDLSAEADWRPDYVVFSAGENIGDLTNAANRAVWREDLVKAAEFLKSANPGVKIVYKTVFWPEQSKNKAIFSAAEAVGAAVADLGYRGNDRRYQARGLFKHSGVACHPGDLGMEMIAETILRAFGFLGESACVRR